jgi:hypothetical protein
VVFQGVGPGHAILGTIRFEVEIRDSEEVQLRIDDRGSGTGETVFHERNCFDDFGEILNNEKKEERERKGIREFSKNENENDKKLSKEIKFKIKKSTNQIE